MEKISFDDRDRFSRFLELLPEFYIRQLTEELSDSRIALTSLKRFDLYYEYQKDLATKFSSKVLQDFYLKFNKSSERFYLFLANNFSAEVPGIIELWPRHRHSKVKNLNRGTGDRNEKLKPKSWTDYQEELKALLLELNDAHTSLLQAGFSMFNPKEDTTPLISFNKNTGQGLVDGREFRLGVKTPEYRVFRKLFDVINESITRTDVLVIAGAYEEDEEISSGSRSVDTMTINEIAKNIRKRTGLDTKHLSQNQGTLTLSGRKT
jgi:hypothetical protein